ncbi:MAG TPA: universal stress protein [Gemmatimonadota bacterium]|nr:universal stress protein [Gemmatimonadota bacterium]
MFDWKSILAATDFSTVGENAVRTAAWLAERGESSLAVVCVADPSEARRSMAELLNRLRPNLPETRGFVRAGKPWSEIVRLAEELDVDAIVLGSTGLSRIQRLLLGSTAEGVVRHASCPVLIVRHAPLERIRRILLPVDMDEGSKASVRYALERVGEDVELEAIHVIGFPRMIEPELADALPDDAESATRLREFLDDLGAERVRSRVVLGEPAAAILDAAREADLVLIATRGRKGFARALLGSVAEKVVRHSEGPVLVVPPSREGEALKKPVGDAAPEGEVHP